ncbi:glycosyl hydrolase family 28-related protein [Burkholderia sp. Ac-20379]|uniref:glycosyl hydrolase family 28-related protein n=1 Tax=Burkholderia sp. Ac-20379 TaxID=2703900 RepID=UPI0019826A43|nr:glycosyl hydrolase family 28-related protein [Burkholderia sp. Ac-20379]MBN3727302.1 hypothetical protein [Burkholderia sp. Ac-20379]
MQSRLTRRLVGLAVALSCNAGAAHAAANQPAAPMSFRSTLPGTIVRSIADKLQDTVNFRDYGGKCDGATDDSRAMTNALSHLHDGASLEFPAGTCVFSTPQQLPIVQNVSIRGAGARQTVLLYAGRDTRADLWTVGDGRTSMSGWSISGLRFDSRTTMTGGAALRLRRMQNGNELSDIDAGVFTQRAPRLYNGVWLDDVNVFKYSRFNIQVQNEGLMMNGAAGSDEGSDIYLDNGAITFSHIAYHVGGGQGGVYFGKVLAFGNGVNYQIDNGIAARRNREIFFSDQSVSDGSHDYGIWINDRLTSNAPIVMNGAFASSGMIGSGGNGTEIYIESWPHGRVTIGPGQLYNATADGLRIDDPTTIVSIDAGRHIFNNAGFGVNATVPTSNIYSLSQYMSRNRLGNYSENVHLAPLDVGAGVSSTTLTHRRQQIDKSYRYRGAANAERIEMASGEQTLILDPATPLSRLSIVLPACDAAYDGSLARFSSTRAIARLDVTASAGSVAAEPGPLNAGGGHQYLCRGQNATWYSLY